MVEYFQGESKHSAYLSDNHTVSGGVFEVLTIAFAMIGEVYSRVGTSLPVEIWKSTIEVCMHFDILKRCRLKIVNLGYIFVVGPQKSYGHLGV